MASKRIDTESAAAGDRREIDEMAAELETRRDSRERGAKLWTEVLPPSVKTGKVKEVN